MPSQNADRYSTELIHRALTFKLIDSEEAQRKMMPVPRGVRPPDKSGRPRLGSVLLLLYQKSERTHLVLTRRRDDLNSHPGQVSFPGGRIEDGEEPETTALREAEEEIGVEAARIEILGGLSRLYIPPTDYEVHPFAAWLKGPAIFVRQEGEVAEIIEVPLGHLLDPANQYEEPWDIRGFKVQVPFYKIGSHKVWGATAMILSEFLERLRMALA